MRKVTEYALLLMLGFVLLLPSAPVLAANENAAGRDIL